MVTIRLAALTVGLCLHGAPYVSAGVAGAQVLACDEGPQTLELGVGSEQSVVIAAHGTAGALLRLDELGQELEFAVATDSEFAPVGARPPRLGLEWIPVLPTQVLRLRRATAGAGSARVRVELLCRPSTAERALAECAAAARVAAAEGSIPPGVAETQRSQPLCAALIEHAAATWASRKHRPRAAIDGYERAIRAWSAAGDAAREGAAWLGLAEQRVRVADYAAARRAAERAETLCGAAGQPYFALRARMERCLALDAQGDGKAASHCLTGLAERQAALGEWNDAANIRTIEASIALDRGDPLAGERHVAAALQIETRHLSPLATGRLRLVEALVAVARGRLDAALVAIDASLNAFEAARDRRGLGNAQLAAATLLLALDAPADARTLAGAARSAFEAIDAPARTAAAHALLARIAQVEGQAVEARAHAQRAAAMYRAQEMPWRALDASITAAELGEATALEIIATALRDPATPQRLRVRARLALASEALQRADLAAARAQLAALDQAVLDPTQLQRHALIEARLALAAGDPAHARAALEAAIARVHALAALLPGAALRLALGGQLGALGALWIDAWAALPAAQRPGAEAVWHLLAATASEALLVPRESAPRVSAEALARFEAITAQALLGSELSASERDLAPRALLAYEAQRERSAEAAGHEPPALAAIQAELHDDERLLALASGQRAALRLDVRRDAVALAELPVDPRVQAALAQLGTQLLQPTAGSAAIDAAARTVSAWLFDGIGGPRPARLLVAGDMLRAIGTPGLLYWPGDDVPLIDSTPTAWLVSVRHVDPHPVAATQTHVFIAAEAEGRMEGTALPALANAAIEADWITEALGEGAVTRTVGTAFTRAALAQALARPGASVHIATHGMTQRGLLGQSGLLLPRGQGSALQFVSWIGLADQPVRAALLVLNACALAASPSAGLVHQTAFANALAAAGARDTIAARWPISDGAAAIWVPTFYRARARAPHDPGAALRAAQAALRASRMYRHPHYWGALIHLHTLAVARHGARR